MATPEPPVERCNIPPSELLAFADGELPGPRQESLAGHIAACPCCQQQLTEVRWVGQTLRVATPLVDDPVAQTTIRAHLFGFAQGSRDWWKPRAMAAVSFPLVLAVVLVASQPSLLGGAICFGCRQSSDRSASGLVSHGWLASPPPVSNCDHRRSATSSVASAQPTPSWPSPGVSPQFRQSSSAGSLAPPSVGTRDRFGCPPEVPSNLGKANLMSRSAASTAGRGCANSAGPPAHPAGVGRLSAAWPSLATDPNDRVTSRSLGVSGCRSIPAS
jgi:hypothetical protein